MRPSSSQLFCVRHALTFRSAREPRCLIFHILSITLTLEALASSRLWPFHSDRAFSPQPLHLSLLSSTPHHSTHELASYLNTFPHKICSPHFQVHRGNVKCVLHFSNGVFNSLAPVKRGDDVDQLRKTEKMGESEEWEGVRETRCAVWFLLSKKKKKKNQLSSTIFHLERCVVCVPMETFT